jgi:kinetochore protein Spc25
MVTSVDSRSEDVPDESLSQSKNKRQPLPAKRGATALLVASPGSLRRSLRSKAK